MDTKQRKSVSHGIYFVISKENIFHWCAPFYKCEKLDSAALLPGDSNPSIPSHNKSCTRDKSIYKIIPGTCIPNNTMDNQWSTK